MKSNTKSSITLPPSELKLVMELMKKTGAKTKVEVIRLGLWRLKEATDRKLLKEAYRSAVESARRVTAREVADLDGLTDEGLVKS